MAAKRQGFLKIHPQAVKKSVSLYSGCYLKWACFFLASVLSPFGPQDVIVDSYLHSVPVEEASLSRSAASRFRKEERWIYVRFFAKTRSLKGSSFCYKTGVFRSATHDLNVNEGGEEELI